MKSTQTIDKPIRVGKNIMDLIVDEGFSVAEALNSEYMEVLAARREQNPELQKLSAMQIALLDAGVTGSTKIGKVLDQISTQTDGNELLFPAWIDSVLHESLYGQDIMQYVVGSPIMTNETVLKAITLNLLSDTNKDATKMKRVAEGADLPLAEIATGSAGINLWKRGRAVQMTYEAIRRLPFDVFAKIINAISRDISGQEISEATYVLLNGDGNSNPATSIGFSTGTANVVTADEYVKALVKFYTSTNLNPTTVICSEDMYNSLAKLRFDPTLSEGAYKGFGIDTPQINISNIKLLLADVPKISNKNVAVIFNKDYALNKYVETGSQIQEYDANIRNQTQLKTISETAGFAKFDANAVRYLASA